MRNLAFRKIQILGIAMAALFTCFFTENSYATTRVVMFGGSLGFVYSPSSFTAKVGDTVKWEGAFSTHPLSSTTIPANAASWHMGSGSTFSYVITVAGTYNYHCDVHFSIGMVGSFTATGTTGIDAQIVPRSENFSMNTVSVQGRNMVQFNVPNAGRITLKLFDLTGREISTVFSRSLPAGAQEAVIGNFPAGLYFIKLFAGGNTLVKAIQIVR
jgi:plastocyanin